MTLEGDTGYSPISTGSGSDISYFDEIRVANSISLPPLIGAANTLTVTGAELDCDIVVEAKGCRIDVQHDGTNAVAQVIHTHECGDSDDLNNDCWPHLNVVEE